MNIRISKNWIYYVNARIMKKYNLSKARFIKYHFPINFGYFVSLQSLLEGSMPSFCLFVFA
jgi:hypothetical protein